MNIRDYLDYEPSPSDLEELCYSLLYLRVLEQLKEVRDRLSLSQPSVEVVREGDRISIIITMNDTDLLLEAATEYLLKGTSK